jgi:hypothetical protein
MGRRLILFGGVLIGCGHDPAGAAGRCVVVASTIHQTCSARPRAATCGGCGRDGRRSDRSGLSGWIGVIGEND